MQSLYLSPISQSKGARNPLTDIGACCEYSSCSENVLSAHTCNTMRRFTRHCSFSAARHRLLLQGAVCAKGGWAWKRKAQSKVVSTVLVSCGAFLGHVRVLMTSSKAFFCPLAWSLFFFGSWCRQSSWHLSVYGRGREELLSVFQSSWCLFLMWKDLWPKKPAVSEPAAWGGAQDWGDTDPAISFWDVAWWESLRLVYLKFSKPFHVTEAVGTSIVECHSNENLVFKKIIQL